MPVYAVAVTVDVDSRARTHLANERTFLAWFRTGITLVALGLAAAQFLGGERPEDEGTVRLLATLVVGAGAITILTGFNRYRASRQRIEDAEFEPAGLSVAISTAIALLIALVAVVFVLAIVPVR